LPGAQCCQYTEDSILVHSCSLVAPLVQAWQLSYCMKVTVKVTGQLTDPPTRGIPTRGQASSWTAQVTDWTARRLVKLLLLLLLL